jgi:hypothetical protein
MRGDWWGYGEVKKWKDMNRMDGSFLNWGRGARGVAKTRVMGLVTGNRNGVLLWMACGFCVLFPGAPTRQKRNGCH